LKFTGINNEEMKTGFGENVGKINIVPQYMGRVLPELFNNAFYVVMENRRAP
jgi:hypothetical protein